MHNDPHPEKRQGRRSLEGGSMHANSGFTLKSAVGRKPPWTPLSPPLLFVRILHQVETVWDFSAHPAQLLEVTGRKTAFDFSKATDVCQLRCNRVSEMFKTTCASKRVCHDSLLFLSRMVHRQSQFGIAAFVTWFTLIQGRERRQKKNHWETEVGTTNHRINEHVGIKKRGVKWRVNCD